MRMKKYMMGIITGVAIFLLAACGSDPRKEFTNELFSSKSKDYNAASFEMKIKDLTYDGDEGGAYVKMIASQLKDMSIEGNYAIDDKKDTMEMEITANLFGEKLPFQFVGSKDNYYMSTSFVSGLLDLANSFGYPLELSKSDLNELKGKYIDIAQAGDTLTSGELDKKTNPLKNKSFTNAENSKMGREVKKLIESFDKKSFTADKDVVTHTFTKKEIIKIMEKIDEVAKENKEYKKSDSEKEMKDAIKSLKNDLDKMDIKVSINEKTKAVDMEMALAATDEDNAEMSIVMSISTTPKKNSGKIKMPSKKEIISQDKLESILENITGAATNDSELDDDSIDYSDLKDDPEIQEMLDAQLDEMIERIEANPEAVTEEKAKEVREEAKEYLNDKQMKKLNDALDKALKAGTV
ncbi:hypothetical protein ATZ33_16975 [Enterococcus silesiacus]|uniref:Lipoprotein n=1 Tax=Enterococcus silesiacus TaxID=332949 RepID=A0A0S3KFD4_9ENTE|nr:hypothetical protein [Enterococcus silesiacus]ALS03009.1 hypothetical protein ATZ33_16975 [Enterococcus silesiacus]OJG92952.1 hypothetical protein RV15_GL002086 [Enterococcus silesiacus]